MIVQIKEQNVRNTLQKKIQISLYFVTLSAIKTIFFFFFQL